MPFPMESLEQMQGFFWILVRVGVLIFFLPLFGANGVPALWKAGVSLMIAIILSPVVPIPQSGLRVPVHAHDNHVLGTAIEKE